MITKRTVQACGVGYLTKGHFKEAWGTDSDAKGWITNGRVCVKANVSWVKTQDLFPGTGSLKKLIDPIRPGTEVIENVSLRKKEETKPCEPCKGRGWVRETTVGKKWQKAECDHCMGDQRIVVEDGQGVWEGKGVATRVQWQYSRLLEGLRVYRYDDGAEYELQMLVGYEGNDLVALVMPMRPTKG